MSINLECYQAKVINGQNVRVNLAAMSFTDSYFTFNEVTAKSFLREDFDEIYLWAMGHEGVTGAESAKTFRKGRKGRAANSGTDGKKLQPQTVSTAEN